MAFLYVHYALNRQSGIALYGRVRLSAMQRWKPEVELALVPYSRNWA